jgi:FMN-dependent NADH-azoreductase
MGKKILMIKASAERKKISHSVNLTRAFHKKFKIDDKKLRKKSSSMIKPSISLVSFSKIEKKISG